MFNIVFCSNFSLKDLVYFLYDVERLLFWRPFENCIIEDIFGFIGKIFLEDNSSLVWYKLYKCVAAITCLVLTGFGA